LPPSAIRPTVNYSLFRVTG